MRIISTLFITMLFGLFISSCSNDDNNDATTLRVSSLALLFNSNDTDAKEILITTDAGSWKAEKSENWVTITPQVRERRLLINVDEYKIGKTTREATVTVTANGVDPVIIKVTQAPNEFEDLTITTDVKQLTFDVETGSTLPIEIITKLESYEIACNQEWIKYEVDPVNKNILHITATEGNNQAIDRKAVLVISGDKVDNAVVEIIQTGLLLELDQEELEFGPNGKTQTVKVTTNLKEFTVKGSEEWVKCEIDEDDKSLIYISANADGIKDVRYAKVTVAPVGVVGVNIEIPILQKALVFNVSVKALTFKNPIKDESATITVESNFDWEIIKDAEAIWFTAEKSDTDPSVININTFKSYVSAVKESEITISAIDVDATELTVKIVQNALDFKIQSPYNGVVALNNNGEVKSIASIALSTPLSADDWVVSTEDDWISAKKSTIYLKELEISATTVNFSTEIRTGTVVVTAINAYSGLVPLVFTINQDAFVFEITSPIITLTNTGEKENGTITTSLIAKDWTFSTEYDWIIVERNKKDAKILEISAKVNDSAEIRSGTVVVTAINAYLGFVTPLVFTINQEGTPILAP